MSAKCEESAARLALVAEREDKTHFRDTLDLEWFSLAAGRRIVKLSRSTAHIYGERYQHHHIKYTKLR